MEEGTLISLINVRRVLGEYSHDAVQVYGKNLALGRKRATGKLIDTVTAQVEWTGTGYEVSLNLQDYWKYVEGGQQGKVTSPAGAIYPAHFPPIDALEKWVNVKPILPRPDANGKIPTPRTLAFLIGRKIANEGIEPHPALQATIDELNAMYLPKLQEALLQDVGEGLISQVAISGRMSTRL